MSPATASSVDAAPGSNTLSDEQMTVCREFIGACLDRLRINFERLLGQPVAFDLREAISESDIAIRVRMPASGGACTMKASVDDKVSFLMMELPLLQTLLGLVRILPDEEVQKVRGEAADLEDQDRTDLDEVGSNFSAAFNDEAGDRTNGAMGFEPARVLAIKDSSWVDGEDPVEAIDYVTLTGTVAIGKDGPPDPFNLLIPEESLGRILPEFLKEDEAQALPEEPSAAPAQQEEKEPESGAPPAPEPVSVADEPDPEPESAPQQDSGTEPANVTMPVAFDFEGANILCLGSEEAEERLVRNFNGSVSFTRQPGSLIQQLEGGETPDLVAAFVSHRDHHVLKLLSALRQHPAIGQSPILVLLEEPTKRGILICGQLGLWNVLPADAPPAVVLRRLHQLLRP